MATASIQQFKEVTPCENIFTPLCQFMAQNPKYPSMQKFCNKKASWLHAELFLCWFPCGFLDTTWCPCRNHMVSTFETTWCPHLKPHSVHMETMEMTWKLQENYNICSFKANFKLQLRQDMETMWFPPGNDIISTCRNDVEIMLFPSFGISP